LQDEGISLQGQNARQNAVWNIRASWIDLKKFCAARVHQLKRKKIKTFRLTETQETRYSRLVRLKHGKAVNMQRSKFEDAQQGCVFFDPKRTAQAATARIFDNQVEHASRERSPKFGLIILTM
jgi:hypothetical protein